MDTSLYRSINAFAVHTAWAHSFMKFAAVYGVGIFALLVLTGWWYARFSTDAIHSVAAIGWAAIATVLAVGVNQPIVNAVARPRPFLKVPGAEVLVARSSDYSFPSDHAVAAGAATMGLWIAAAYGPRALRWLAGISTVLALFIAFARVYVGVHYPGDVAAGLVVGAAVTTIGWLLLRRVGVAIARAVSQRDALRPLVVASIKS